jgi:hypothetical protein
VLSIIGTSGAQVLTMNGPEPELNLQSDSTSYIQFQHLNGTGYGTIYNTVDGIAIQPSNGAYNWIFAGNGTLTTPGDLDLATHQIHNVVDPTSAQDAATRNYVDNAISAPTEVDLINVAADATAAIVTPAVSGMYLVSVYAVCTASGTGGDAAPNLNISWTDQSGFNQNYFATPLGLSATLINYGSFPVYDMATNPISYNITGGVYSTLRYDISFVVQKI